MGSPIEDANRDFALSELNKEATKMLVIEDEHEITINIHGWEFFRAFRDEDNNIEKIVLRKNGYFKEFVPK